MDMLNLPWLALGVAVLNALLLLWLIFSGPDTFANSLCVPCNSKVPPCRN